MNSDETNFMVFLSGKNNGITVLIMVIRFLKCIVVKTKYISLHTDDDLNWKNHIEHIYGKLLRLVWLVYFIKYVINYLWQY